MGEQGDRSRDDLPEDDDAPRPGTERWLRTNESEEVAAALEFSAEKLAHVGADLFQWRWVIFGLHLAAQGAMAIAVRDSAGLTVMPKRLAAKWIDAYELGEELPPERLDWFLELYAKTKDHELARQLQAVAFQPTESQEDSLCRLHSLRNRFAHFVPGGWSLEVSGLPLICLDVVGFVEFLLTAYRSLIWHDDDHPARFAQSLSRARDELDALATEYANR